MELNDIKKFLYKNKPKADLLFVNHVGLNYQTIYKTEDRGFIFIQYTVPLNDIGDGIFSKEMDAQYLIRWIKTFWVD